MASQIHWVPLGGRPCYTTHAAFELTVGLGCDTEGGYHNTYGFKKFSVHAQDIHEVFVFFLCYYGSYHNQLRPTLNYKIMFWETLHYGKDVMLKKLNYFILWNFPFYNSKIVVLWYSDALHLSLKDPSILHLQWQVGKEVLHLGALCMRAWRPITIKNKDISLWKR